MSVAKVPKCYLEHFWRDDFQTTTYLDGVKVVGLKTKN
jgi:hypothetical protein